MWDQNQMFREPESEMIEERQENREEDRLLLGSREKKQNKTNTISHETQPLTSTANAMTS